MSNRQHLQHAQLFRPGHPEDLVETYGGLLVALAVALVAFSTLYTIRYTPVKPPANRDKPINIVLMTPPPVPELVQMDSEPREPSLDEVAATSVNPSQFEELIREAMEGAESADAETQADAASILSWEPTTSADRAQMAAIESQLADYTDRIQLTSIDTRADINRLKVESAGREFMLNSDGGREGAIRTIDVEGYDMNLVMPVLNRYGITVENRYVRPSDSRSFLNAANMEGGTFTSVATEGYHEVFMLSAKALSMLASLEMTALRERGYDLSSTRVRQITFGIIPGEGGLLELGVTDLKVERWLY